MDGGLDAAERALVERIADRRDEIVGLARELIAFDTTSRAEADEPAREEAALQQALADRLQAAGAEIDLWEPAPEDVANHPLSVPGIAFAGRPQLAATLRGSGGGRSLLLNGHIDVVPARRAEGWTADPFDPQVSGGNIVGRGACDMKGGIAAMVIAAEALAATGELKGDVIVCTNTDEESSGVGGLACARHGVSADFAIVPEPSSLEVWPACRGTVYCTITLTGRAGHAEQEHPHWRDGGAVNAIEKGRFLLAGVDRLRAEWRSRADLKAHPLLDPPDIVPTRFVGDAGWHVTIPDRAEIDLSVLILPQQADAQGWTKDAQAEVEGFLRRWCETDSWLAEHPPHFNWYTEVNPSETPLDADSVVALRAANRALGLPDRIGGLGSWYDGATFALEANTPALMYGPRAIDWAHTVDEYVPIDDLVTCAQGIAIAGWRLCR
ncbi:M20/M25/M40 family metallo-hydrolase [Solirubrobacter sp. CPCC 204708]|uniref:M20/M25/M40 family metallo-hydrolase n=1 Tax=Solirubrobacter deserti TaxID=2282478 RepID=A0ABT4RQE4_9ACTN|nr:M20/M25/M40 family metallo-hydrolase [Solirubrobacter deserti]MBE2320652.1 M20/M25/M40 family metallo-hydrolase [Solirubrobacter deserti]MDA0140705.1 M20/M25/M40 family metallo-hydrolase [Solirubrobacter deserti]